MIPDKIYTFQDDGDRYWYKPEEWETPPLTRVEYIRKDALLEWAEEMKDAWEGCADTSYYQEFIDKINSI